MFTCICLVKIYMPVYTYIHAYIHYLTLPTLHHIQTARLAGRQAGSQPNRKPANQPDRQTNIYMYVHMCLYIVVHARRASGQTPSLRMNMNVSIYTYIVCACLSIPSLPYLVHIYNYMQLPTVKSGYVFVCVCAREHTHLASWLRC